jgi:hypothetical protein
MLRVFKKDVNMWKIIDASGILRESRLSEIEAKSMCGDAGAGQPYTIDFISHATKTIRVW